MEPIEKLKSLRAAVNWQIVKKRHDFRLQLYKLTSDWRVGLPELRDVFCPQEIDWLLSETVKSNNPERRFIEFVASTGYKDEPKFNEDGKPLLRRTTPVHHAARRGFCDLDPNLFKIYDRFDVNYIDEDGYTHFHAACMSGCIEAVEKFLEFGQDPNLVWQTTGESPLHLALGYKSLKVFKLLLKSGANPNLANKHGWTPLHVISMTGKDQIRQRYVVKLLLRSGANPNLPDNNGYIPLHIICNGYCNDTHLMKMLLELSEAKSPSKQLAARDKWGNTPLHLAVAQNDKSMIVALLKKGANPYLANDDGSTSLHFICRYTNDDGLTDIFFYDAQRTAQVNVRDKSGRTPLYEAIKRSNQKMIEKLLMRGADPNLVDKSGHTPLQLAVARLLPDAVDSLLDRGADLSSFVFPTPSFCFEESGSRPNDHFADKLKRVSGALACCERLEKRGYKTDLDDALTIMRLFAKYEWFPNAAHLFQSTHEHEELASEADRFSRHSNLPRIRVLTQRPAEETATVLAYADCRELAKVETQLASKISSWSENSDNCDFLEFTLKSRGMHLCELISRRFFRSWALNCFLELVHYRLPVESCDTVIENLMNEDLYNICLAAAGQN